MGELSSLRKNKICLSDYDYQKEIDNRLLMAQLTTLDIQVIEEILYSSLKISIKKLAKSVDAEETKIMPILEKLNAAGLLSFEGDSILIDKEARKSFETQMLKFDPDFRPGMEFLQSLLRRVPIHILPIWYSIPRTSNNIFDSLVEKHLLTPQIFQRYLNELSFTDPVLLNIVHLVYESPLMKISGKEIIEKFHFSHPQFEEMILLLEFHLVCCLGYEMVEGKWEEIVTPFSEWQEYTKFLEKTVVTPIKNPNAVTKYRPEPFSFVNDFTTLLKVTKKHPIPLSIDRKTLWTFEPEAIKELQLQLEGWDQGDPSFHNYLNRLVAKACQLKLADIVDKRLYALEGASDWLEMRVENRALLLYRHPLNHLTSTEVPQDLLSDRNMREAEKSILRVLFSGWVYFDDFIQGVTVPLGENSTVMLKKQGKTWKYYLPTYTEEEITFIKAIIFDWLFEIGVTSVGTHEGKLCFSVTPFGQSLFG